MRILLSSLAIMLSFLFLGCTQEMENNILTLEEQTRESNLISHHFNKYLVIFNKDERIFYGIQHLGNIGLPKEIITAKYKNGQLILHTASNEVFSLSTHTEVSTQTNTLQVLGITEFSGHFYEKLLLLSSTKSVETTIDPDADVSAISCRCRKEGLTDRDCDAGGEDSPSCSRETGAQVGNVGVINKCSVSCNEGFYACCIGIPLPDEGGNYPALPGN